MRVLYVSHFGGLGGAERSLLELMVAVREHGTEPILACPTGSLEREATRADIPVVKWCARPLTRSPGANSWQKSFVVLLRAWREMNQMVRRFQPHILHANSTQAMLWNGPVGLLNGCPVIWHWRDFYEYRWFAKLVARWADVIVPISSATMEFAVNQLGHSARRLVLVRNGIADLPPFDANHAVKLRRSMGISASAPLVVMAGHSVPRKGHAVLLQALARLVKLQPDLRAWLLCSEHCQKDAEYTRLLRRNLLTLGCGNSVKITEGVEKIAPVLYTADIVVVPSLREPFGRIAVEAMLAERPVVASAVDGLNEIVIKNETGLLVPPNNPELLAESLNQMLNELDLWVATGAAARLRALQLFSVSRVAKELVNLYETVGHS